MSAATSVHAFFASRTATAVDEQVREEAIRRAQLELRLRAMENL